MDCPAQGPVSPDPSAPTLDAERTASADPAPPSGNPVTYGPLTYAANRALLAARPRVPGTVRIAIVGDGMAFGAGLPYRRSLAARLAIHLNGALPAVWAECLPFGVPGACASHALGRAIAQVLPTEPDILLLCIGAHDAPLLAPETNRLDDVASDWKEFGGVVQTALHALSEAVETTSTRALVVYYDAVRMSRDMCVPDLLAAACADAGLSFLDVSGALDGHPEAQLRVSDVDRHLNALGTDLAARYIAQQLIASGWTPEPGDYPSGTWLDAIAQTAQARIDAGLAPAIGYADALGVLEAKWMHRANSAKREFEGRYQDVRRSLLERHGASVSRLAMAACGRALRRDAELAHLEIAERATNDAIAAAFALDLVAAGNTSIVSSLTHLIEKAPMKTPLIGDQLQRWRDLGAAAAALRANIDPNGAAAGDALHDSPDLQFYLFWTSRVGQWARTVEHCAARYVPLLTAIDTPGDARLRRLIGYTEELRRAIRESVDQLRVGLKSMATIRSTAHQVAGAGSLMLELTVSAPQGQGHWSFSVGVDSEVPAFTERTIAAGQLVRDGRAQTFEIDLPLMLEGEITVRFAGVGLSALRILSAVIRWPQRTMPALTLRRPRIDSTGSDGITLIYANVQTLDTQKAGA